MTDDWFYLSFSGPTGFLGGVFLPADSAEQAIMNATCLGLCPGFDDVIALGPVAGPLVEEHVAVEDRGRLLNRRELGPVTGFYA